MYRSLSHLLVVAGLSTAGVFAADPVATSQPPDRASSAVVALETYVVTASPFARTPEELGQPVTILAGPTLDQRRAASLGETLDGTPGVASTYFGPGASRPIIRGLGGERIRILTDGLGAIDVSANSPDHAVSLDPALTKSIEIVRGPATLLYGSSAAGGVVNLVNQHVPHTRAESPVSGSVELRHGSNADTRSGSVHVAGGANDIAWQLSLLRRRSGDAGIPGHAESLGHDDEETAEEEHESGVLPNSAIDVTSGSAGLSWLHDRGYTGAAITSYDTLYGVPGHEQHHEEGEAEEHDGVRIDLKQRRLDLTSAVTAPFGPFRSARLRAGFADYEHLEIEGDEIGTRFTHRGYEARLDLLHLPIGALEGAIGAQLQRTQLDAAGDEAFLPPSRTRSRALFAVEETVHGAWRSQFGARIEDQRVALRDGSGIARSKLAASLSAGTVLVLSEAWTVAASLARTERIPTAQELFAHGPHIATAAFEIGDADLGKETSVGLDLSLRRRAGPVTGVLNVFVNDVDRFIFEDLTGEEEDGLPVYRYTARDARFHGAEVEATWHLHRGEGHGFDLTASADFVRAEERVNDTPLPRIPPFRAALAIAYRHQHGTAGIMLRHVARQTRTATTESATAGYELLSAYGSWTLPAGRSAVEIFVRGSNLLDAEARPHTSFLKDVAPLPGRNVTVGTCVQF